MKALILILSLFNGMAFAGEIPSRLADGKYTYECWFTGVKQYPGETTLNRVQNYSVGETTYKTEGDQSIVIETNSGTMAGMAYTYKGTTTSKYEKLEDGFFKETAKTVGVETWDAQTTNTELSYERTFRVQAGDDGVGQFEFNVTVQNNTDPTQFGLGESGYQTLPDGRIAVSGYVREKYDRPARKTEGGAQSIPYLQWVSNSLCLYKKAE